jgi:Myotubularin-like phosphatase domain
LLKLIGRINSERPINVHVYDARPFNYAFFNKMNGAGYEQNEFYQNCEVFFLGIDNIHAVRESYKKISDLSLKFNFICETLIKYFINLNN